MCGRRLYIASVRFAKRIKKKYVSGDAKSHIPIRVSIALFTLALQDIVAGIRWGWLLLLFFMVMILHKGLVGRKGSGVAV